MRQRGTLDILELIGAIQILKPKLVLRLSNIVPLNFGGKNLEARLAITLFFFSFFNIVNSQCTFLDPLKHNQINLVN